MTTIHPKTKRNPKGAGRKPLGLPPRKRHNLNVERTALLDQNLKVVMEATGKNQTEAVKAALFFYALHVNSSKDVCPKCNGLEHIIIKNGDDDTPCDQCQLDADLNADMSSIPY